MTLPAPLELHAASPAELSDRLAAERAGTPFLVYRGDGGAQALVILDPQRIRVTLGRRTTNDVVLAHDLEVSRLHATLERLGDDWTVMDDGLSHNGTYVNGKRLTERRRLRDGDTLKLGATLLVYCAPGSSESAAATLTTRSPHLAQVLTSAQRRVLLALCRPLRDGAHAATPTNPEIAKQLMVSVDTVKGTMRSLFELFGIDELPQNEKRATLAVRALSSGTVTRHDLCA